MSVTRRFKGYFLHGLAVLLPSILTIWLFIWGYTFIQNNISSHINGALVHIIALATWEDVEISETELRNFVQDPKSGLEVDNNIESLIKDQYVQRKAKVNKLKTNLAKKWVDGPGSIVGFIIAVIAVCVFGALLASYVGRSLWRKFYYEYAFIEKCLSLY